MHIHMQHRAPRVAAAKFTPMTHSLLGVKLPSDEPHYFLDQAYALASILEDTLGRDDPCNQQLLEAAARGVCTLIHLTATSLANTETCEGEKPA